MTISAGGATMYKISVFDDYYTTWSTDTYIGAKVMLTAFPAQMLWRASDESSSTTATATTSPLPGGNTGDTVPVSRPAVVAISVVVGVAFLAALVFAAIFIRHGKRRAKEAHFDTTAPWGRPELDPTPAPGGGDSARPGLDEPDGRNTFEMDSLGDGRTSPHELHPDVASAELHAGERVELEAPHRVQP